MTLVGSGVSANQKSENQEILENKTNETQVSWKSAKLHTLCQITTGKKDVDQGNPNGKYPFFSCAQKATWSDTYSFDTEAILIAGNGDVGNTKYYKGKFEAYQRTYVLQDFTLHPLYLYFYLAALIKPELIKKKVGSTMPYIKKGDLENFIIHFPPLSEQRTIAYTLQTAQQAIQIRRKELELERERKAALMQYLFTHGTRNEPTKQSEVGEIPESWEIRKLGEALQNIQYGISLAGNSAGTYPILRMNNLVDGVVLNENLQYVNVDEKIFKTFQLKKGDILFNRTNSAELVGKTALFNENSLTVFASYLIRITTNKEQLLPDFLNWYFNWEIVQKRLRSIATRGVSQANISASNLQNFKLPIPPIITEQAEIANLFNLYTTKIAALEKEITLHEELFRALLDELMTGRISTLPLVEQLEKGTLTYGQRTSDGTGTTYPIC